MTLHRVVLLLSLLLLAACSGDDGGPAPTAPVAVDDLAVVAGAAGSLTLTWTSPAPTGGDGALNYELRHCAPGNEDGPFEAWTQANRPADDSAGGTTHQHTVTGLTTDATYVLRLRVRMGQGAWSPVSNTVMGTAAPDYDQTRPAPVAELRQWAGTSESATVGWTVAGNDSIYGEAAAYEVRWHATASDWESMTPAAGTDTPASLPGWRRLTIGGLVEDASYFVRVQAVDAAGNRSAPSATAMLRADDVRVSYVNVEGTGDYPTIEAATDSAGPGDLILVGPGRYTWTNQGTGDYAFGLVHVKQNNVGWEIRSLEGPGVTILDSERQGPVFHIAGAVLGPGEEVPTWPGITVDGFTFTGGRALGPPAERGEGYAGGGFTFHLSNAVLRNSIVTGNQATQGGGIWYGGQGIPVIENCLVTDNRAVYNSSYLFEDQSVSGMGGGILIVNTPFTVNLSQTIIRDNVGDQEGGGLWVANALIDARDVTIVGNEGGIGGGIWMWGLPAGSRFVDCAIISNKCLFQGGGIYARYLYDGCTLLNCTIAGNDGRSGTALRLVYETSSIDLENCVVALNVTGDAFRLDTHTVMNASCSVSWGHDGDDWPSGYEGVDGNFSQDPLFCDLEAFTLGAGSPCLPGNHPDGEDCGLIGARGQDCSR